MPTEPIHSLYDISAEHQGNYILWRLALAMGIARDGDAVVAIPDLNVFLADVEAVIKNAP